MLRHYFVKRLGGERRKHFAFFGDNDWGLVYDSMLFPFIDILKKIHMNENDFSTLIYI